MFILFRNWSNTIYKFLLFREYVPEEQINLSQRVVFWMVVTHYMKEVFEALAV